MIKRGLYEHLKRIVEIHQAEGRGATYRDLKASKGYARHIFHKLSSMGLIKKVEGTWPSQYIPRYEEFERLGLRFKAREEGLTSEDVNEPNNKQIRIDDPVEALERILERLEDEPFVVHDIQCIFYSKELRETLDRNPTRFKIAGWKYDKRNNQWQSPRYRWGKRRWIFVRVSQKGTTQVFIQCTDEPIQIDLENMMKLMYTVGEFRNWLLFQCIYYGALTQLEALNLIPSPTEWRVFQWHFGKDSIGVLEASGFPANNITLKEWGNGYVRLYMKSRAKGHVRLEKIERPSSPEKTLFSWLGERASMAEALKYASSLAEEHSKAVKMNQETLILLHEFSVQLKKHLAVLSAMQDAINRMNILLDKIEKNLGRGDLSGV